MFRPIFNFCTTKSPGVNFINLVPPRQDHSYSMRNFLGLQKVCQNTALTADGLYTQLLTFMKNKNLGLKLLCHKRIT